MKNYNEYSQHSVAMVNTLLLSNAITKIHRTNKITHLLETGTNIGLGSTKMYAEIFKSDLTPPEFITIEANWRSWRKARKNLNQYRFVKPIWGLSVEMKEALEFISVDDALNNPESYANIFIDGGVNPIAFYKNELSGEFGNSSFALINYINMFFENKDRKEYYTGDDLLRKYLTRFKKNTPLISLDSAGGTGLLEFNIVKEIMDNDKYYLILDDIHHLKHFRSYEEIKGNSGFEIIEVDEKAGWVFTKKI